MSNAPVNRSLRYEETDQLIKSEQSKLNKSAHTHFKSEDSLFGPIEDDVSISQSSLAEGRVSHEGTYELKFIIHLVSVAAIGGFLFGYDTGVISGAQLYFVNDFPGITEGQKSMIVSMALAGAAVGSLFSGIVSDYCGRKRVIMFADVMFTIGSLLMGYAPNISILLLGRVVIGIGVGIAAQIVPLYLAEISPQEIRGRMISFNVAMITLGQLLAV